MTLSSGFAPHAPKARARRAGFSLIELLVGVVLAFVLLAAILSLFNAYNTSVLREEQRVEVQQAGRNSIRLIRDDLELVGADVVRERGQAAMVFAAPWEVVFNANIDDTYGELADGVTMPHGGADSPYTGSAYESDAETIRYWTGQPDATTRDFSVHSSDRVIYKKVNDHDKAVLGYGVRYDDGTIPYRDGSHVAPLFSFWGDFDFDESTPPTLWGDTSGDGALSNAEREALFKGEFSWSYQGPTGTINVGNTPGGAVYLNRVGGQPSNRENDDNGNGQLDASEDLNRNGRFDTNLLDSAITRVDLNVTVISQFGEPLVTLDRGEQFREYAVSTTVAPRNLGAPPSKDCGGAPGPPTNAAAAIQDCGYGISVSWNRSADDGLNDNDVMWYEVFRKIESSTSPHEWVFHAFVPATNSASYTYLDANVYKEPIYGDVDPDPLVERIELIGYDFPDHQYRIQAVDCGDSHSGPSDSNTVSPTTTFPTNPPEIALWDTPCFIPSSPASMTEGSITVMWTASTDAQVDEYWIYRSDPNITTEVNGYEIARVDIADVNSACATAAGSLIQAEKQCVNEDFYRWGTTYVWRDQPGSPGRNAVAPPINGRSFGLSDGGYGAGGSPSGSGFDEEDMAKYTYEVKSYRSNDECLSTGLRYVSACDNYNEAQSYNCYDDTALPPGRFSPPWNVLVYDTSVYDSDGTVDPAMTVYWDASPSQFCESSGSPNNDIPDLSRYYVYRSKQPMTYDGFTGRLQRVILREDSTAPFDPTGEVNVFDATQKIIVFKGVPRADATFVYSYEDTPDIIAAGDAWYAQTGGGGDLRPNTGATVSQNFELQHNHIVGGPFDPSLVYEYMVAGVTANAGASALPVDTSSTPWSFGASCVEEGRFDCPCPGDWATSDVEYCSLRNTTVNDTGDAITVSWTWDEAAGQVPPAGATVRLVTRDINTATSDWGEVDTVIAPPQDPSSCGTSTTAPCVGFHRHEDMCWGQLNVYGLLIECVDEDVPVCNRILNLGVIESPGAPDQAHVCFETQHPPGTPDCNSYTGANCQTGQVEIALRDVMANCSTQITTSESYMWWRAVRYSTNTYDPFTGDPVFPVEPDNGSYECVKSDPSCTGTCSTVDNPPGQCFGTFHYTGYWMRLGENLAALQGANGYSYPAYAATGVNLKQVENVAGRRSYVFSEYVNPALSYKYIFSVLVEQNGGATTRPNCTGDYYECGDTCNGGFDGLEEFQVIVDFANKSQCYPQISGQGAGNASTPNTRPPNATAGTWDNFNWTGAGEELESSDKPWMSDEISILGLTNEYTWEYSGSYIRSDLDGFFGTILSWLLGEIGDFFFSLCGDCILDIFGFCIIDMDALWPDCEQDTTELANHNFAWSNFFAPVCGSNGPGSGHYFDGDYMVHYHFRVNQEDRTLHAAYRGRYTPWQNSFNLLQLEFDMNGGGGQVCGQLSFRSGTQFQDVSSPTCIASGDESFDDEWFANFTLICTNRVAGAFNEDETYAFTWSTIDPAKTKDWKPEMLTTPPTLSWTTHTRTLSAAIAPVEKAMEGTSMPQGCSSHCSVTGNGYSCNANAPLRCVIYQDGKFGFWANPEVDFESTEYQYDNVRIDPYCGQCPPSFLATSAMSAESAARTDTNLKAGHIKEYGQRHRK